MFFLTYLLVVLLAINTLISLRILWKNHKAPENRYFSAFVTFLDLWIVSNYLENEPGLVGLDNLETFLRLDFVFAIAVFYCFFRFAGIFVKAKGENYLWANRALLAWTFLIYILSFTDWIVKDVEFHDNVIHFADGNFWILYALTMLTLATGCVYRLIRGRLQAKKRIKKRQIDFILFGFCLSIGNAILINLILQTFFPISLEVSRLGLYGMSFIVIFTAYAVLRYKLMNLALIATEIVIAAILIVLLAPLFDIETLAKDPTRYALEVSVFGTFFFFSVLLARSVAKEVALKNELAKANKRLKSLDKLKDEFIMTASHELKTPMTAMANSLSVIRDHAREKENTGTISAEADAAYGATQRLVNLVDNLLDIAQIENNVISLDIKKIDLSDLTHKVCRLFRNEAYTKNLELDCEVETGLFALCDEGKTIEVLGNFIKNAIKYTPAGEITVRAFQEKGRIRVEVQDTGIGLNPQDRKLVFQKFNRIKSNHEKHGFIEGTGLGLWISKNLIEKMKGRIGVNSKKDKGSTFWFTLPMAG